MSSAHFWKLSWKMSSPNTAALTRWEYRLDVQKVPTCFKVYTSSCHTGVWDRGCSSRGRLGRPATFPAPILVYFINLGKSTLNGHLKSHPRRNIHTVFGRLNTKRMAWFHCCSAKVRAANALLLYYTETRNIHLDVYSFIWMYIPYIQE